VTTSSWPDGPARPEEEISRERVQITSERGESSRREKVRENETDAKRGGRAKWARKSLRVKVNPLALEGGYSSSGKRHHFLSVQKRNKAKEKKKRPIGPRVRMMQRRGETKN